MARAHRGNIALAARGKRAERAVAMCCVGCLSMGRHHVKACAAAVHSGTRSLPSARGDGRQGTVSSARVGPNARTPETCATSTHTHASPTQTLTRAPGIGAVVVSAATRNRMRRCTHSRACSCARHLPSTCRPQPQPRHTMPPPDAHAPPNGTPQHPRMHAAYNDRPSQPPQPQPRRLKRSGPPCVRVCLSVCACVRTRPPVLRAAQTAWAARSSATHHRAHRPPPRATVTQPTAQAPAA